jgi:hypothetical protein
VTAFDPSGAVQTTFTFTSNPAVGLLDRRVLLATTPAQTMHGITPDLVMNSAPLSQAGGMVCWETFDCVAWGSFTGIGTPSPVGALAAMPTNTQSLTRVGTDTDVSANDFVLASPTPTNNAGQAYGVVDMSITGDLAGADLSGVDLTSVYDFAVAPDLSTPGMTMNSGGGSCAFGQTPAPTIGVLICLLAVALLLARRRS